MDRSELHSTAAALAVIAAVRTLRQSRRSRTKVIIHPGGPEHARGLASEILAGSDKKFFEQFRMRKPVFQQLLLWLERNAHFRGSRYQSAEQKLMIFLWVLGHGESQRNAAHRFQVSQSSVHRLIQQLLAALEILHVAIVRPKPDDWLDPSLELDPTLNSFSGCIGAIDGTHIPAHVHVSKQLRWRDRKGAVTQNVFAAVRRDLSFSYVLAGAEGSMNDASLCDQALSRSFTIPAHRYYLGDSGFGMRRGIVVPFPGVRYHLQDWRNAGTPPETRKELYNLRHARIRACVERAFGLLKRRFKIIRHSAPEYSIDDQLRIVYATTALHNFIIAETDDAERDEIEESQAAMEDAKERTRVLMTALNDEPDRIRHSTAIFTWDAWKAHTEEEELE
jgi:hypothetical protein